jgi:hypothetical protein
VIVDRLSDLSSGHLLFILTHFWNFLDFFLRTF